MEHRLSAVGVFVASPRSDWASQPDHDRDRLDAFHHAVSRTADAHGSAVGNPNNN
jgi:hypothetical protein